MARYEERFGTSHRFWEITRDGVFVTVRDGIVGARGTPETTEYADETEAQAAVDRAIAEHEARGFRMVGKSEAASHPEFEAAITERPDEEEPYLVYGDWLTSRGDVRGDLIAIQSRRAADPGNKAVAEAERDLLELHREYFLGRLAEHPDEVELDWHLGFIRSARLSVQRSTRVHGEVLLGSLLNHPSARFIRELTLGLVRWRAAQGRGRTSEFAPAVDHDYYGAVGVMVSAGARPTLRRLIIGDFEKGNYYAGPRAPVNIGGIGRIWANYSGLREVVLRGRGVNLGNIELPELRSFELHSDNLTRAGLQSICNAHWPALERLVIRCDAAIGRNLRFPDFLPLLQARKMPNLKHLGLLHIMEPHAEDLCRALPDAPVLKRLKILDLSDGQIDSEAASFLLARAAELEHLEELKMTGTRAWDMKSAFEDRLPGVTWE